ncbi:MAG TPA: hypothetical protein VNO51_11195 [Ilumatobacteraceae bacterium]|nr:hypothetical protein [Ilumatobacteraceae bacterium]
MADRTETTRIRPQRLTLSEFVRREVPHLRIASMSQPEPELAHHNVVAATRDIDTARAAVLALEALEANDARLGLVVLSTNGDADVVDGGADPEGVTGMVASRTLIGGALGALAGALLIGGATALFANASAATAIVAAVGGAFIGGVFGAIWVVFAGMGGSDAYRQSFIAPELTDVCIVSLHTDDPAEAANGRDRLAGNGWLTIVEVDGNGKARRVHHPNG